MSDGTLIVGLNVNFNKAFDTTYYECVNLKLM